MWLGLGLNIWAGQTQRGVSTYKGGGLKAEAHRVHGHLGPFIRLGPPREDEVLVRKMLTWTADSLQNGFQGTPLETSGGQD